MPMSDHDDLLANPRDLFLRPHVFIVHSEAEADDQALAEVVAKYCRGFARPQSGTLADLKKRSLYRRVFPGITFLILSHAMITDPTRRAELVQHMLVVYQLQPFRHYCVCRGLTAVELRAYPELEPLLDNIMVGDTEQSLQSILAELHDFATRELPAAPQLARPISSMLYHGAVRRTLAAFALGFAVLLGFASRFAIPAALGLGVLWWLEAMPAGTAILVSFTAFNAGFRMNYLQCSDTWPWLRQCWKLPHNIVLHPRKLPTLQPVAIGPFSLAGVAAALYLSRDGQWTEAAILAFSGMLVQSSLDYANTRHLARCLAFGPDADCALQKAEPPDAKGTRLSLEALYFAAGGVLSAFVGGALVSAAFSALLLTVAFLAAARLDTEPVTWVVIAALTGFLLPAVIEEFTHSGITYLGEQVGLSSARGSLYKMLAGTPSTSLTLRSIPAHDRPLVAAFPPHEQKYIVRWLSSLRVALRPSFRRWRAAPDHAFISYAWKDDNQASTATAVAEACKAIGLDAFLDKVSLQNKQGVFRTPIAAGLSRSTHVFLIVTQGVARGNVVRREIEMAMGRWPGELIPAIICVVDPAVREAILADPAMPLPLRFLLTFCPNIAPAEAAQPALVRYIVELTRRGSKWSDWRILLSPSTAVSQVIRLPGIYEPDRQRTKE